MLHAIGLHRDLAIGFHTVQAVLVDQHRAEEAVILQRVGDIPAASDSKLALIDFGLETTVPGVSDSLREVRILPHALSRLALLHALGLQQTCVAAQGQDPCLVFFNNVLWEATSVAVRNIDHGVYIRIVEPRHHQLEVSAASAKRTIAQSAPRQCRR
jgi:hypothetical protein